jgi:hypothetical protein
MKGVYMKTLRNQQGLSLIFVLASMLFLLALGVSALTAAGLSHRAVRRQAERNRLEMVSVSMERVMRDVLVNNADITDAMLRIVYEAFDTEHAGDHDEPGDNFFNYFPFFNDETKINPLANWEMTITPTMPAGIAANIGFEVAVTIDRWFVDMEQIGQWIYDPDHDPDDPNIPDIIRNETTIAGIRLRIAVTQTMLVNNEPYMVIRTEYENYDGRLQEQPLLTIPPPNPSLERAPIGNMTDIDSRGTWILLNREVVMQRDPGDGND